ncbi:MAG: dihydrodipicolinate synthase family protein [Promethearchaeota archaeon]
MFGKHLVAVLTPFTINGDIDYGYIRSFIPLLIKGNVETIIICGTTGEGPSVTIAETEQVIQVVSEFQRKIRIILGIFRMNVPEVLNFLNLGEEYQIDGVLLLPPFYFKNLSDDGLFNYFSKVMNKFSIPVILYNIPKYTGVSLSLNLIRKLSEFSQLFGIKDSSGDITQTRQFIQEFRDIKIYSGNDALIHKSLLAGSHGVITALSNAFPNIVHEIIETTSNNQLLKAESLQTKLSKIRSETKKYPQIANIKTCVERYLNLPPMYVRPPLINLNEEQKKKMVLSINNILMKRL